MLTNIHRGHMSRIPIIVLVVLGWKRIPEECALLRVGWRTFRGGPIPQSDGVDAGNAPAGQPCRQGSSRDYPGGTVDLNAHAGITFWAMAEGSGSKTIRVEFNDTNTDPRGGIYNAEDPSNESNCYNGFGMYVVLTDTLTQHTIAFSNLQQDPTRQPSPSVFDAQHVYVNR